MRVHGKGGMCVASGEGMCGENGACVVKGCLRGERGACVCEECMRAIRILLECFLIKNKFVEVVQS